MAYRLSHVFLLMLQDISVSLGHDEPPSKLTVIQNEQRTKTLNVTAGLSGGKPMVTGAFTHSKMDTAAIQAAEDVVRPKIKKLRLMVALNLLITRLRHSG
jgi:hypothetical protein